MEFVLRWFNTYAINPFSCIKAFKSSVVEVFNRLPGSNCADGVQHFDDLGLIVKTTITQGKAISQYHNTLTNQKYSTFVEFLQNTDIYDIKLIETANTVTNLVSSTGTDISQLL